jgi:8-oxo-dGTP diphosphatase
MADIYIVGGIIIKNRKLVATRSKGKQFFISPGGKFETGETARQALVRELGEELQILVQESDLQSFGTFTADAVNQPGQTVQMEAFMVLKWQGEIKPSREIEALAWVDSTHEKDMKLGHIFADQVIPQLKRRGLID